MMWRLFVLAAAWGLVCFAARAQNLVPNPGFEQYYSCPTGNGYAQTDRLTHWYDVFPTPDYYNCGAGVPVNLFGSQIAHSGTAYVGQAAAEHLGVRLTQPLQAGKLYRVEFFTSRGDHAPIAVSIGVYFGRDSICRYTTDLITGVVNSSAPLTDTVGWMNVSGNYIASGCERYLTLLNTDTLNTYYYFDDLSVQCIDPQGCGVPDCSHLHDVFVPNVFTPNQDGPNDTFYIKLLNSEPAYFHCTIFNRWGDRVAELDQDAPRWDGTHQGGDAPDGVYYYLLRVSVTDCGEELARQGVLQLLR